MTKALGPLLAPETVAVIGASRNPLKVGGSVMANLRAGGFGGRIVPVNSRAESVQGCGAVKSVLDIDKSVDLAVVAIPAEGVLPALRDQGDQGRGGDLGRVPGVGPRGSATGRGAAGVATGRDWRVAAATVRATLAASVAAWGQWSRPWWAVPASPPGVRTLEEAETRASSSSSAP